MNIGYLYDKIEALTKELSSVKQELKTESKIVERQNGRLKEQLAKHQTPRNGRNSSMPPSKDGDHPKPGWVLREKTGWLIQ